MAKRKCWDCHWRERTQHNAEMSTCHTRHVGGVLVRDNRVVSDGFNGNLPGLPHCADGKDGCPRCHDPSVRSGEQLERCLCCHCEENLISYCAKNGVSTAGTTCYLPVLPCLSCLRLLILSGIKEIVFINNYIESMKIIHTLAEKSKIVVRKFSCRCVG